MLRVFSAQVLWDCHFAVAPGQLHMLLGANGWVLESQASLSCSLLHQPAASPVNIPFHSANALSATQMSPVNTMCNAPPPLKLYLFCTGAARARCCGWRAGCCSRTSVLWPPRSRRDSCSKTRTTRSCCRQRALTWLLGSAGGPSLALWYHDMQILPCRVPIPQNPDHQVVLPNAGADVAFGRSR